MVTFLPVRILFRKFQSGPNGLKLNAINKLESYLESFKVLFVPGV